MLDLIDLIKVKYTIWKAKVCSNIMLRQGEHICGGRGYEKSIFGKVIELDIYARCKFCRMYNREKIK